MTDLLFLDVSCICGSRPNWRITQAEKARHRDVDDDEVCGTWRCSCGEVRVVRGSAYKRATTEPRKRANGQAA